MKRKRKMVRVDSTEAVRSVRRFIKRMKNGRSVKAFDGPGLIPAKAVAARADPASHKAIVGTQPDLFPSRTSIRAAVEAHEGRAHDAPVGIGEK